MKINEIMTRNPDTCSPNTTCNEAARKMRDDNVGALPVCDEQGKCVGIVTDRDMICNACAQNKDTGACNVQECMSSPVQKCYEDESAEDAARLMAENQIRRLPVFDRNENIIGMVSLGDVSIRGPQQAAGNALKAISQPS